VRALQRLHWNGLHCCRTAALPALLCEHDSRLHRCAHTAWLCVLNASWRGSTAYTRVPHHFFFTTLPYALRLAFTILDVPCGAAVTPGVRSPGNGLAVDISDVQFLLGSVGRWVGGTPGDAVHFYASRRGCWPCLYSICADADPWRGAPAGDARRSCLPSTFGTGRTPFLCKRGICCWARRRAFAAGTTCCGGVRTPGVDDSDSCTTDGFWHGVPLCCDRPSCHFYLYIPLQHYLPLRILFPLR